MSSKERLCLYISAKAKEKLVVDSEQDNTSQSGYVEGLILEKNHNNQIRRLYKDISKAVKILESVVEGEKDKPDTFDLI